MASAPDRRAREAELKKQLSPEVRERLIGRLERQLDLARWEFRLSHVYLPKGDKVVYDSPWCRVKFSLLIEREGDEIHTWYARSHVPNDVHLIMEWQGERCFAWHHLGDEAFSEFLEGSTPEEAAHHFRARSEWPARAEFAGTELGERHEQADYAAAFHGYLWRRYGERLFSLFDLRQPERWQEFRLFLRRYYELLPDDPLIGMRLQSWGIPPWNVC